VSTTFPKAEEIDRNWYVVDATDQPAGRLAVKIANVIRGKAKPIYTPHVDTGDHVIVINAEKVKLTGSKDEQKIYKHYTGYPSGLREYTAKTVRERNPTRIMTQAVRGMLPKTRLGRQLQKRLHVYTGATHPHQAQQPVEL
jgi:large subunit ribosomal protein L13